MARLYPADPFQRVTLALLLALVAASCVAAPYREFLLMQHAPTVAAVAALSLVASRFAISRSSFALVAVFLAMHTLGARYLYSYVPYDAVAERLFGVSLTEMFDWRRNHYDRLVHFSYGLLLAIPIQEFERRHLGLSRGASSILAIECILATSAAYELTEWLVAVTFSPRWADQFLGQQGDIFDGQKDMALATAGAVLAIGASLAWGRLTTKTGDETA
jgi:putative membrane protein